MLEKDIENLISLHPDEFFPNEGFELISQQYQIDGRKIDILFSDKFKRKIIVEVKRGILSREASGQVMEYYGLLKTKYPNDIFELILCANTIPRERALFLESSGIQCSELGIIKIIEIAKKYSYTFLDEKNKTIESSSESKIDIQCETKDEISTWIFQANPNRYDILNAFNDSNIGNSIHGLVNQHKTKIKKGHIGLIWMSGKEAGIYAITRINCDPTELNEFPSEMKYWIDSEDSNKKKLRVQMTIIKNLTNCPIAKVKLLENIDLKNLSILNHFQGTNFPVRNEEWNEIAKIIPN